MSETGSEAGLAESSPPTPIRVLILEDHATDAELMVRALRRDGFEPSWTRVQTETDFIAALDPGLDVILSDYRLPSFDGMQALKIVTERQLEVPFILISGSLGDELAAAAIREGATDYLLKDRLGRLGQAVTRAMAETRRSAERKRSDEALRTAHAQLRHLLANSPAVIYEVRLHGDVMEHATVSDNITSLLGFTPAEATAEGWWLEHLHPEDRTRISEIVSDGIARHGHTTEYRMRHRDGTYLWLEDRARVMRSPDGASRVVVGALTDITDRVAVQAALRDGQIRQELATQASNIGPWDWDLTTNEVYFSPEWKHQIGYEDHELPNTFTEWESRLHPDDRERILSAVRAYIEGPGGAYDVEFRFRHRDGTYRWIHTRGKLALDAHGKAVRMLGCHIDLTDRKQATLERAELAQTMQLLLDSTGEGIYGIDLSGCCTFINRSGARAVGWEPDELIGRNMHTVVHHSRTDGSHYPQAQCPILMATRTGQAGRTEDEVFWRRDGSQFPVGYSYYPIAHGDGILGSVVTFADVTERKRLDGQLRQAQKLEALGQLTGGVAHDFNNLLTVILGYAESLLEDLSPNDPRRPEVDQIRKAGESAAALTRQLLAFSRQQVLRPTLLNLNEVVTSVENLLRRLIGEDVALATVLGSELWSTHADANQIEQVLLNLAVNARDAMSDGGRLTITTGNLEVATSGWIDLDRPPGRYVMLAVSDNGCGMSEAVRSRIFDPFFTTKAVGRGTGLGLATVFGIVQQSTGYIDVESEEGKGSTFRIYLPQATSDDRRPEPAPPKPVGRRGSERVLLVEDDEGVRALAATVLERAGYVIQVTGTAEDALALGIAGVDLLITDLVLPGLDGRQLAAQLRTQEPALKVLFTSGYSGSTLRNRRQFEPGEAFLAKPFTPRALTEKVREILDA